MAGSLAGLLLLRFREALTAHGAACEVGLLMNDPDGIRVIVPARTYEERWVIAYVLECMTGRATTGDRLFVRGCLPRGVALGEAPAEIPAPPVEMRTCIGCGAEYSLGTYALMNRTTGQRNPRCPDCARKMRRIRPICTGCGTRTDSYKHRVTCRNAANGA